MLCAIQIGQKVPARPRSTNRVSRGISVTWIGTICRAKTATKRNLAPRKSIQAKP